MRLLLIALLICAVVAEEAPRQADPTKPADALAIVTQVCAKAQMSVAEAQAVLIALQTLNQVVHPPANPTTTLAPAEPKPEGAKP